MSDERDDPLKGAEAPFLTEPAEESVESVGSVESVPAQDPVPAEEDAAAPFAGILPEARIEPAPSLTPPGAPAVPPPDAFAQAPVIEAVRDEAPPSALLPEAEADADAPAPVAAVEPSRAEVRLPQQPQPPQQPAQPPAAPGGGGSGRSRREERDRPRTPRGPHPDLVSTEEPLYRDRDGYRMRLEPADLARLRELPGSKGKTDRELGETFFDGQSERFVTSLAEDVPAPAEVRVVVDPYSRQAFLAVERKIRSILSF